MRKYQQLGLLIISSVCVILLLFYRHEYLKLRDVLSVLNFFGNVDIANATCLDFNVNLKESIKQRYKYAEPRSVWSKLDNHYLYSSFWENHGEGGTVRTLTVGPKATFFNYRCRVWFEGGDIIISEQGTFTFDADLRSKTRTPNETTFKYFFKCIVKTKPEFGVPYGVLWLTPSNLSVFSPIFNLKKAEDKVVVCVQPDYSGAQKTELIEFISYYNLLGVDDFIIYDSGIQHSIIPFLESIVGSDGILQSVTFMSWNFPVTNLKLERQSLIDDCLSRTYHSAKLVGIVSWNEYIMPTKQNLNVIPLNKLDNLINISFETWLCCLDHIDERSLKALPTFLRKEYCVRRNEEEKLFVNMKAYTNKARRTSYQLSPNVSVVRRYESCDKLPTELQVMLPVPEFYSHITSHKLLGLWKSHLSTSSMFN